MRWTEDGETIEMSSGHSMDTALGAIRALVSCSTSDGCTMGRNEAARAKSFEDLQSFLQTAWDIP